MQTFHKTFLKNFYIGPRKTLRPSEQNKFFLDCQSLLTPLPQKKLKKKQFKTKQIKRLLVFVWGAVKNCSVIILIYLFHVREIWGFISVHFLSVALILLTARLDLQWNLKRIRRPWYNENSNHIIWVKRSRRVHMELTSFLAYEIW